MSERAYNVFRGLIVDDERHTFADQLLPIQLDAARAILTGEKPDWSWLSFGRGLGKSRIVSGILLAWLIVDSRLLETAAVYGADKEQASIQARTVRELVERNELTALVDTSTFNVRNTQNGAVVNIEDASAAGAYGRTDRIIVYEELNQWPSTPRMLDLFDATLSGAAKHQLGCQVMVVSTAGATASHWRTVYDAAVANPERWRMVELTNFEPPWQDPEARAALRATLTKSQASRMLDNVWADADDQLTTRDDVVACTRDDEWQAAVPSTRYTMTLDVGVSNDATVLTVGHRDGQNVIVDRIWTLQGTKARPVSLDEVEELVAAASQTYNRAPLVADKWQTIGMMQRLAKRGVKCSSFEFSSSSVARLASTLFRCLRDHTVSLPNHAPATEELVQVRLTKTAVGVKLSHSRSGHDDHAVAIALLCHTLLEKPQRGKATFRSWRQQREAELALAESS